MCCKSSPLLLWKVRLLALPLTTKSKIKQRVKGRDLIGAYVCMCVGAYVCVQMYVYDVINSPSPWLHKLVPLGTGWKGKTWQMLVILPSAWLESALVVQQWALWKNIYGTKRPLSQYLNCAGHRGAPLLLLLSSLAHYSLLWRLSA